MKRINKFNRRAQRRLTGSQEQPLQEPWQMLHQQQQHEKQEKDGAADDDDGNGEDFEDTIRKGVHSLKKKQDAMGSKVEDLDKSTKKALEEFTEAKNKFDGLNSSLEEVQRSMKKFELKISQERRLAYGDPIQRIMQDEEKRSRLNAAVRLALSDRHGDLDPVAKAICKNLGIDIKAMGEDTSPGSTLIDDQLANEIYNSLESYGAWATLGVRRLGTKITKFPVKTARPIAYYLMTEADTIPDDANVAGSSVNAEVEIIACLINISLQLLQDSGFDVTGDVMRDFSEAFNYRLDFSVFQGAGTATGTAAKLHGGVTGLCGFATAVTAEATENTVEELDLENFMECQLQVDPEVLNRNPQWWMHTRQLIRTLAIKDLNGRPLFLTALEAPAAGKVGTILGAPVNPVNAMPSANTAGTNVAVFGDKEAFVVGVRQDWQIDSSDHARWNTYQRSFRGVGRATGKGRKASALTRLVLGSAT